MLTPDERAALVAYCRDHPVAVCPHCAASVAVNGIGADIRSGQRDSCLTCRGDLTDALRQHLTQCTWMRVQVREARERAQETLRHAQEIVKDSHQVRDMADVLARDAEPVRRESRDVKRGRPPSDGGTGNTPSLAGVRIIVVEQNADIRDLLDEGLSLWGARVATVTCARDAVARASEADVIVTDVAMGNEDGVWLWAQVNLQPHPVPVIAVTGYTADQYPRMKHARFARTFLKPVDPEKLAGVICEVLDGR